MGKDTCDIGWHVQYILERTQENLGFPHWYILPGIRWEEKFATNPHNRCHFYGLSWIIIDKLFVISDRCRQHRHCHILRREFKYVGQSNTQLVPRASHIFCQLYPYAHGEPQIWHDHERVKGVRKEESNIPAAGAWAGWIEYFVLNLDSRNHENKKKTWMKMRQMMILVTTPR